MPSDRQPHALPEFATVEDERRHRKQRLAAGFRLFGHFGFDEGVAGHITARDPELDDHFWVNPFGMSFKQIRVKDLLLVNHQGEVVEGNWPVNQAAFAIHSAIHAARPDVVAAAHSHSVYGKTLSSLHTGCSTPHPGRLRLLRRPRPVRLLHRRRPRRRGGQAHRPRPRREQGRDPRQPRPAHRRPQRRRGRVVVHHHGALAARPSSWPWRPASTKSIDDETARPHASQVGSHLAGWMSFQPLYDWIIAVQPDLLDE